MIEGGHENGYIASVGADAGGAQRGKDGFRGRGRQRAESGEDGTYGILTDGRVVKGGTERVGREDGRAADAGDDEVKGIRGSGGLGLRGQDPSYGLGVADIALNNGEMGVNDGLGDGAF